MIDFRESRVVGHSAIEPLNKVTERCAKLGKLVTLRHLSPNCKRLMGRAGALVEVNYCEDPKYRVASGALEG